MSHTYCLEIEFPTVDFSSIIMYGKSEVSKVHRAHLSAKDGEIGLKIYYNPESHFGEKFMHWIRLIDRQKLGTYMQVRVIDNHLYEGLKQVDLSEAKLVGFTSSTDFFESGKKFIFVKINTAKFYWNVVEHQKHSGEFYLDDRGFKLVESYYTHLTPNSSFRNDGKFSIRRKAGEPKYNTLGKSKFHPEFDFLSKDGQMERIATITKVPKIQFTFKTGMSEKQALLYGDIVLTLAAFYHHSNLAYIFRKINLPEHTITIRNIEQKHFVEGNGNLFDFGISWNFSKFLNIACQKKDTERNFVILEKAIMLFNQALLVDSTTAFLIRYNIIEICDKQKASNNRFTFLGTKGGRKTASAAALGLLLTHIKREEHEEFKKRWTDIQTLLHMKPMKNQLISFLESQKLQPDTFPVTIKELYSLRNDVVHGSIDDKSADLMKRANILLYRISGILILNLMGIEEWKLHTSIHE